MSTPAAQTIVDLGSVRFGNQLALITRPCQLESRQHALEMATALKEIAGRLELGLEKSLPIFAEISESLGLPVLTDMHEAGQCAAVTGAVDIL